MSPLNSNFGGRKLLILYLEHNISSAIKLLKMLDDISCFVRLAHSIGWIVFTYNGDGIQFHLVCSQCGIRVEELRRLPKDAISDNVQSNENER